MSKKIIKFLLFAGLLTFGTVFVNAAGVIKIGAIVASTGPASFIGSPELKTLKLYVKKINNKGGVLGKKIKLIYYDTGANPRKAVSFAKRLIFEDKVVAIIGPSTTGETMAIIPFVQRAKIPLVSMGGGISIIKPVKKYVFKIVATDKMACKKLMGYMKKEGITKIGMISGSGGFGKSMRKQCKEVAPNYGIKILADETYGKKDTDMTSQLIKIKNTKGIQAVLNPGFGQGPAIVTKNYRQLKIPYPLFESHGVASKKYIEIAGKAANGVILVSPPVVVANKLSSTNPLKKVCMDYTKEYKNAYHSDIASFGGHAYDSLYAIVDAIKKEHSINPQKIRDGLESLKNFVGIDGVVNMSKTNHLGLDTKTGLVLLRIKNGDWSVIK